MRETPLRGTLAALAGTGALCIVWVLRERGVIDGWPALALLLIALLGLPTAESFSGRILVTGCAVLGWNQVLWWRDLPGDRVGASLAVVVGVSAAVTTWRWIAGAEPFPHFVRVDAVPGITLVGGLVLIARELLNDSPTESMARMMAGWDNAGHFAMFHMILAHGRTVDLLPPPAEGDAWNYAHYPEAFHATTASIAQLMWPADSDPSALIASYEKAAALVVLGSVTVLVAGVSSQRWLRSRPEIVVPVGCLIAVGYLMGLGRAVAESGFSAFVFPCALVGACLFVTLHWTSVHQSALAVAFGGAAAGVAHGWLPLVSLLAPMIVALLLPPTRIGPGNRARLAILLTVCAVTTYAVWRAVAIVIANPNSELLIATGQVMPPNPWLLSLLCIAPIAMWARQRTPRTGELSFVVFRLRTMAMLVPTGLGVAALIGFAQYRSAGGLSYYWYKYLVGLELVLLVLLGIALALAPTPRPATTSLVPRVAVGVAGTVLAGLAASQSAVVPSWMVKPTSYTSDERWQAADATLRAVRFADDRDGRRSQYLAAAGPVNTMLPGLWYLALNRTWTVAADTEARQMAGHHADTESISRMAERWLRSNKDSGVRLVVLPELRRALRPERSVQHPFERFVVPGTPDTVDDQSSPSENADSRSCCE